MCSCVSFLLVIHWWPVWPNFWIGRSRKLVCGSTNCLKKIIRIAKKTAAKSQLYSASTKCGRNSLVWFCCARSYIKMHRVISESFLRNRCRFAPSSIDFSRFCCRSTVRPRRRQKIWNRRFEFGGHYYGAGILSQNPHLFECVSNPSSLVSNFHVCKHEVCFTLHVVIRYCLIFRRMLYSVKSDPLILVRPFKVEIISETRKPLFYKDPTLPNGPRVVDETQYCTCRGIYADIFIRILMILVIIIDSYSTSCEAGWHLIYSRIYCT